MGDLVTLGYKDRIANFFGPGLRWVALSNDRFWPDRLDMPTNLDPA
jgi:hypothetical protein